MKNAFKALEAIEYLTGDGFGMYMEDLTIKDDKGRYIVKKPSMKILREAAKVITKIYMISHAEGKCKGHPSWEDIKYKVIEEENKKSL